LKEEEKGPYNNPTVTTEKTKESRLGLKENQDGRKKTIYIFEVLGREKGTNIFRKKVGRGGAEKEEPKDLERI